MSAGRPGGAAYHLPRTVEIHLAGVLRLEFLRLEVDDDEGTQLEVVEEQSI